MTCKHQQIRTWVYEDTKEPSGLWSCVDCGLKFEPITQRTWVGLTDEEKQKIMWTFPEHTGLFKHFKYMEAIEAKLKQKNGYAKEKNT